MISKKKYIVFAIIAALIGFLLICLYSIHFLNTLPREEQEGPNWVLDQLWQNDLGISADDYLEREVYTDEMYELDRKLFVSHVKNQNFDLVVEIAKLRTQKYKFEGNYLSTINTLTQADIWNEDSTASINDKTMFITGISDPELYIMFFMLLNPEGQAQLIRYKNVNRLPGWPYEVLDISKEPINHYKYNQISVDYTECYKVTLKYKQEEVIVRMIESGCLCIFDINNADGTYNSITYN
jgi:hypothetical protein